MNYKPLASHFNQPLLYGLFVVYVQFFMLGLENTARQRRKSANRESKT
jgi:hypothetical protein